MRNVVKFNRFSRWFKMLWYAIAIFIGIWLYRKCTNKISTHAWKIENSPIQVTQVRKISELAILQMDEEYVLDTVEYYKSSSDELSGNSIKLRQARNFKYVLSNPSIKRRLCLIVKSKAKIGFDLSSDQLQIFQNKDSVWIHTGKAKVLSVEMNPLKTRVFLENGSWTDADRNKLLGRIPIKIEEKLKQNQINKRVEVTFERMLKRLLKDEREILVYHDL